MDLADPETLIEIFRQQAASMLVQAEMAVANDRFDEKQKKQKLLEREEKEERERLEQMVEATAAQMAAFHETLDTYDTATVSALMDNQKALDAVRRRIESVEAAAHRLPDGRMVFKTEDGQRVFDRDGVQLSHDVVHADEVPDAAPRWEVFSKAMTKEHALIDERLDLLKFQEHLDAARQTAVDGHLSTDALAKMDADLRKAMPDTVKAELPGAKPQEPEIDPRFSMTRRNATPDALLSPSGP